MASKIEIAVEMTCDSCVKEIEKALSNKNGIHNFSVDLQKGSVIVESALPISEIINILHSTGRQAILKGYGDFQAAVAAFEYGNQNVKGVVRFSQLDDKTCIIDGTIDGLSPGRHHIHVHESGDLSNACANIGEIFMTTDEFTGDLGNVTAGEDGRAIFRLIRQPIVLSNLIGRSLIIKEEGNKVLSCAIIARSAGLFQNPKKICLCSGTTIWDEENKPKYNN